MAGWTEMDLSFYAVTKPSAVNTYLLFMHFLLALLFLGHSIKIVLQGENPWTGDWIYTWHM